MGENQKKSPIHTHLSKKPMEMVEEGNNRAQERHWVEGKIKPYKSEQY